jgi:hypothetical protein
MLYNDPLGNVVSLNSATNLLNSSLSYSTKQPPSDHIKQKTNNLSIIDSVISSVWSGSGKIESIRSHNYLTKFRFVRGVIILRGGIGSSAYTLPSKILSIHKSTKRE